jgi:type VI secretion system protein ImpJ
MQRTTSTRRDDPSKPRPAREIAIPDAVRWYDGLPLAPQHFQEAARRPERLLDYHLGLAAPYHYGVVSIDIDRGRLAGGELWVDVEAVMPDRLVFRTAGHRLSMRLDPGELRKKWQAAGRKARANLLNVYLAIPWEHPGRSAAGELSRYTARDGDAITDDTTGENEVEVPRLAANARLVVDVEPPVDSAWIPLAQLRLEGESFAGTEYVPPLLFVSPEDGVYAVCARLVERIRGVANRLSERLGVLSQNTDRELIAEARRQIYHLTATLPAFEAMLFTEQSHPYPLYLGLAAMLGQIAPIGRSPVPPPLPAYQHDDLYATFAEAEARVQRIIREGIQESFKAYPFDLRQSSFVLDFTSDWADRSVVLAVRELSGDEGNTLRWMAGAVVGPQKSAHGLVTSRALGVRRERVPRVDDLVPTRGEVLFELKNLKDFFRNDEPMTVFNPARDVDEIRPSELVLYVKEKKPAE